MDEVVLYNRYGKSVYRLCGSLVYDFQGRPRGFLVGCTMYSVRGEHRGFFMGKLVRDRMGKVVGFSDGAMSNGLELPLTEIPPVPYKNLPAPAPPADLKDLSVAFTPSVWSVMQLQNLLA